MRNMKNPWPRLVKNRIVSIPFLISALFVGGGWIWAYFALRKIPQPLVIHFNNYVGVNQIGGLEDLGRVGIMSFVILLVNFTITLELEERDWFLGKFLAAASLFFGILIFIGFAAIISVN